MRDAFLFIGLGNPGVRYERTRHNIGFMVVDWLARQMHADFEPAANHRIAKGVLQDQNVALAKPMTYMNRSGAAVGPLVEQLEIPLTNLLVILDDLNLPFGKLRLRKKGSDGGHNGLASIIDHLQSQDFPRLRIGIGRETRTDMVDFVLSRFDIAEKKQLPDIITNAGRACLSFMNEGIDKSMSHFNHNLSQD